MARLDIIVIEDDDTHAEIIFRCLRGIADRHSVSRLRDGYEAVEFFNRQQAEPAPAGPQLVLLDLNMPGPQGFEILEVIKAHPNTSQAPVVMITSSGFDADNVRSYQLGADWFLSKPVRRDTLLDIIEKAEIYWDADV